MADKGFTIEDLPQLGVNLNIPPFLGLYTQMTAQDVIKTQEIASVRIHIERATVPLETMGPFAAILPRSNRGFDLQFHLGKTPSYRIKNLGFT